jgi:hypothetical protein
MTDLCAALTAFSPWVSDAVLFPAFQGALVLLVLYSAVRSRFMIGGGGIAAQVTRGPATMALFYGAYTALSGVAVALCLQVNMAAHHRVFFVVLDLALIAYLCLGGNWFRNKLVGWATRLTQLERR